MLTRMKIHAKLQWLKATSMFSVFIAIPSDITIEVNLSLIQMKRTVIMTMSLDIPSNFHVHLSYI